MFQLGHFLPKSLAQFLYSFITGVAKWERDLWQLSLSLFCESVKWEQFSPFSKLKEPLKHIGMHYEWMKNASSVRLSFHKAVHFLENSILFSWVRKRVSHYYIMIHGRSSLADVGYSPLSLEHLFFKVFLLLKCKKVHSNQQFLLFHA